MGPQMTRVTFVRHGETLWNREGRLQGWADLALTGQGQQQAAHLARTLEKAKLDGIYCSPLRRARMTAEAIARPHGLAVQEHPGLLELDHGELDGLTFAEMAARYPDILRAWRVDPTDVKLPGGETMATLQARVWQAVQEIVAGYRHRQVVVVSHNLAILSVLCKVLGLPLKRFRRLRQDVAARTVVEFEPEGPVLTALNDRSHLSGENT
ncbi:MAG: histidine phosphatase family protein [Heliobacteriaceae bacterium]|nr:histidine phosphatase family protein [Heliobacteriaceae bacterium]MDD4587801.1 histidine phosphatase family protein [Heliobacteriaceae bacterium]